MATGVAAVAAATAVRTAFAFCFFFFFSKTVNKVLAVYSFLNWRVDNEAMKELLSTVPETMLYTNLHLWKYV